MSAHNAWIVFGGVLKRLDTPAPTRVDGNLFLDDDNMNFVGVYGDHQEALDAWKAASFANVDNALMRFFIVGFHEHDLPPAETPVARLRDGRPFDLNPLDF